jgi:hypothetical protein
MNNVICPHCKGKKQVYHNCLPVQFSGWKPCKTCGATGEVTEEKKAILEIGEDIRNKRRELMLAPSDIAAQVPLTEKFWRSVEDGECELAASYKARSIIEAIAASFVDKFDIIEHSAFNHRRKVYTADSRSEAGKMLKDCRERAKNVGLVMHYEIVERKEKMEVKIGE